MKQTFDYLEHVAISATVCDKEGIVLYQNDMSRKGDGSVVGKNLFNCHGKKSNEKIRHMIETGEGNTYEIIKNGQHKLVKHLPWFKEEGGELAGLIELVIPLPDEYPTFNRDKK